MFRFLKVKALALVGAIAAVGSAAMAQTSITLAQPLGTGVTVADYVSASITSLGTVVIAVIGGYFAFRVVKMGLRWVGKMGG